MSLEAFPIELGRDQHDVRASGLGANRILIRKSCRYREAAGRSKREDTNANRHGLTSRADILAFRHGTVVTRS